MAKLSEKLLRAIQSANKKLDPLVNKIGKTLEPVEKITTRPVIGAATEALLMKSMPQERLATYKPVALSGQGTKQDIINVAKGTARTIGLATAPQQLATKSGLATLGILSGLSGKKAIEDLPKNIIATGLYGAVSNPLIEKAATTLSPLAKGTLGKIGITGAVKGLGNVAEDIATGKLGITPELKPSDIPLSFGLGSILGTAGDVRALKGIKAVDIKATKEAADLTNKKMAQDATKQVVEKQTVSSILGKKAGKAISKIEGKQMELPMPKSPEVKLAEQQIQNVNEALQTVKTQKSQLKGVQIPEKAKRSTVKNLKQQEEILTNLQNNLSKKVAQEAKITKAAEIPTKQTTEEVIQGVKPKTVTERFGEFRQEFLDAFEEVKKTLGEDQIMERIQRGELKGTELETKLKSATNKMYNLAVKTLKEKGIKTDIKELEDYVPLNYTGSKADVGLKLGNSMRDKAGSSYSFLFSRKNKIAKPGYTLNSEKIFDDYVAVLEEKMNPALANATRKGTSEQVEEVLMGNAKKIGDDIVNKGYSDADTVRALKDATRAAGEVVEETITVPKLNILERNTYDNILVFNELGLTDPLRRFIFSDAFASKAIQESSDLLRAGNFLEAGKKIQQVLPEFNPELFDTYIKNIVANGGTEDNVYEGIGNFIQRAFRIAGDDDLRKVVAKLDFQDVATQNRVNQAINDIIGSDARINKGLSKILGLFKKQVYSSALALNISSGVQNISEIRKLLGIVSPNNMQKGTYRAIMESMGKTGGEDILKTYGLEKDINRYIEGNIEEITKNMDKTILDRYSDLLDKILTPYQATEKVKNRAFLHALLEQGKQKGLTGMNLDTYVLKNFNQYALPGGSLAQTQLFKTEKVKTLLLLGQYAVRDLGLLGNAFKRAVTKREKQSLYYLAGLAISTPIMYKAYEKVGMYAPAVLPGALPAGIPSPIEAIISREENQARKDYLQEQNSNPDAKDISSEVFDRLRKISPSSQLAIDSILFLTDYLSETGDSENRVDDYLEYRMKRSIKGLLIPGGNQILNKTGAFIADYERGYTPTTTGDKVRFPVKGVSESPSSFLAGLILGPGATETGRNFYDIRNKEGGRNLNLNATESETFKQKLATEGRESAIKFWEDSFNAKLRNAIPDAQKKTEMEMVADEYDRANDSNFANVVAETMLKDDMEDNMYSDIKKYEKTLLADVKKGTLTQQQYEANLEQYITSNYDWTMQDYRNKQFRGTDLSANSKAKIITDYINRGENIDIASWYKNKLLTLEVAKELERQGVIPSADDLWDKAQMTDPYYQNKELQKLREKSTKEYQKTVAKSVSDVLKAQTQFRKATLAARKKRYKPKLTMRTALTRGTLRMTKPNLKPIKAKKLTLVSDRLKKIGETTFKI